MSHLMNSRFQLFLGQSACLLSILFMTSCGSPQNPAGSPPPAPNGSGTAEAGGGAITPMPGHYDLAVRNQPCLTAWNWQQARYAVCSNHGVYSFLDFNSSDFTHPENLKVSRKGADGQALENFDHPRVTKNANGLLNLAFSPQAQFRGLNPAVSAPNLGDVVLGGKPGACRALVTGSAASCLEEFKANQRRHGDQLQIPSFHFPSGTLVHVDGCELKKVKNRSTAKDSAKGIESFVVTGANRCLLGKQSRKAGENLRFSMKKAANFPMLTTPES